MIQQADLLQSSVCDREQVSSQTTHALERPGWHSSEPLFAKRHVQRCDASISPSPSASHVAVKILAKQQTVLFDQQLFLTANLL